MEQPYSYHDNRFVAYSLGNLLFLHLMTPEKNKMPFSFKATQHGRLIRVEVSRSGIIRAQYLPFQIRINQTNHCLQPIPLSDSGWIDVCGQTDSACLRQWNSILLWHDCPKRYCTDFHETIIVVRIRLSSGPRAAEQTAQKVNAAMHICEQNATELRLPRTKKKSRIIWAIFPRKLECGQLR